MDLKLGLFFFFFGLDPFGCIPDRFQYGLMETPGLLPISFMI